MKKFATLLLLSSAFVTSCAKADDPVMGIYKGIEVKESEILEHFKSAFDSQPSLKGKKPSELDKNVQEQLTKAYINSKLMDEEAQNKNIASDKEFQAKVEVATKQIAHQELLEQRIKSSVTDEAVDKEYQKFKESLQGKTEVKASHILVDSEEKAKEVIKSLNEKGAKFGAVAKKFSKDEGTKSNGGSLGYFTNGQLVPEFEQKAFSMKPGEVSDPVKTQFGWHVIKVEDIRPIKVPSKEEAVPMIKNQLSRAVVEKYIDELNQNANVKITPKEVPSSSESQKAN